MFFIVVYNIGNIHRTPGSSCLTVFGFSVKIGSVDLNGNWGETLHICYIRYKEPSSLTYMLLF